MSGPVLVIDRRAPGAPMLVTWVTPQGRTERALAVKAGRVFELPADKPGN